MLKLDTAHLVQVTSVVDVAFDVRAFTLASANGSLLPEWEPGAHLDVHLPSGLIRQYSLCSDPQELSIYRIAVLRESDGRGGSAEAHDVLREGSVITISDPRNHFPLVEADSYLLCAGGIGITPLLAMARVLSGRGLPVHVVYAGRSRARLPFIEELCALPGISATVTAEDEEPRPDWRRLIPRYGASAVYACGPPGMLAAVETACVGQPPVTGLHLERFTASGDLGALQSADQPFDVDLVNSGKTIHVPVGVSVLEAVRSAGLQVDSSCEEGVCGTCETTVLAGSIDHRDQLLTDDERVAGETMMVCVSRSTGGPIKLAL